MSAAAMEARRACGRARKTWKSQVVYFPQKCSVQERPRSTPPSNTVAPKIDSRALTRGNLGRASYTLVVYSDLNSPRTAPKAAEAERLLPQSFYGDQLRIVYKHRPAAHPPRRLGPAARYMEAVAMQAPTESGTSSTSPLRHPRRRAGPELYEEIARHLGLDLHRLQADAASSEANRRAFRKTSRRPSPLASRRSQLSSSAAYKIKGVLLDHRDARDRRRSTHRQAINPHASPVQVLRPTCPAYRKSRPTAKAADEKLLYRYGCDRTDRPARVPAPRGGAALRARRRRGVPGPHDDVGRSIRDARGTAPFGGATVRRLGPAGLGDRGSARGARGVRDACDARRRKRTGGGAARGDRQLCATQRTPRIRSQRNARPRCTRCARSPRPCRTASDSGTTCTWHRTARRAPSCNAASRRSACLLNRGRLRRRTRGRHRPVGRGPRALASIRGPGRAPADFEDGQRVRTRCPDEFFDQEGDAVEEATCASPCAASISAGARPCCAATMSSCASTGNGWRSILIMSRSWPPSRSPALAPGVLPAGRVRSLRGRARLHDLGRDYLRRDPGLVLRVAGDDRFPSWAAAAAGVLLARARLFPTP